MMIRIVLLLLLSGNILGQDWSARPWNAHWIAHPTAPATEFSVVNFRRTFELTELPEQLPVLVSADNRYQLFVNGKRVGEGPARGDLQHWRYETYDLKDYVKQGGNVIAAIVWNYGIDRPWSQQSYRSAFVLQPATVEFADLQTDTKWRVYHNEAYTPLTDSRERLGTYIVSGPQLRIDGNKLPGGWEFVDYDDDSWSAAKIVTRAMARGIGTEYYWGLVPREIPAMERKVLARPTLIDEKGKRQRFTQVVFPPNQTTRILLDYGQIENMFLTLGIAGGENAEIKVTYAESLFNEDGTKGHRDSTNGKEMRGIYDLIIPYYDKQEPASNSLSSYSTLWFRTGRYVEIEVKAGAGSLQLADLKAESFVYPFSPIGSFSTPYIKLRTEEIWDVAWQTARMCAQETYVDCPYYEQLQYVGDTRIQALISLYVTGDDRLMRKSIRLFDHSRTSDGLTQSRYPCSVPQVIPPYSLSWIEMVGDYWMHRPDSSFVREMQPGVRLVLDWFDQQLLDNGLVGPTKHWNFVDWTADWPWNDALRVGGVPEMEGGSSIISLQLLSALQQAVGMSRFFGDDNQAAIYKARADRLAKAVIQHCWNAERGLFSDTPAGTSYSQHANILALLTGLERRNATELSPATPPKEDAAEKALLTKILEDRTLTQISEYFRFYLVQAMFRTGHAEMYQNQLGVWAAYLDEGFTTFPEEPGETRSDCHAWSASPNYDLLATLAGIRPGSPGFKTVRIKPAYTDFDWIAEAAHPEGTVRVKFNQRTRDLFYTVTLPPNTYGQLEAEGQTIELQPGENKVTIGLE